MNSGVSGPQAVRVALVNDHEIVVRGLERMLEDFSDRIQVVELDASPGRHPGGRRALRHVRGDPGGRHGRRRGHRQPEGPFRGRLQLEHAAELVDAALRKGIRGYLSKSLDAPALVEALERVAAGEQVVIPAHDSMLDRDPSRWPAVTGRARPRLVRASGRGDLAHHEGPQQPADRASAPT